MPRHEERRSLPYSCEQMFDLVADVGRYPEFLPWVIGARITSRSPTLMLADLVVGFKMFRERFTSRVTLERATFIHVEYVNGPLKFLHNEWRFVPLPNNGCEIDFLVDFEFKNRLFESLVGALFHEAVRRMVGAFEKQAAILYGQGAVQLHQQ